MSNPFEHIPHIPLNDPYPNGIEPEKKELLQPRVDLFNEIKRRVRDGERVYVGITTGERKGSIAYICSIEGWEQMWERDAYIRGSWGYHKRARVENAQVYSKIGWEGRRNRIECPHTHQIVYFPDYKGPTVWEKFDKKAAAAKWLKEHPPVDRDGELIEVGDRVLYINARYGGAARLDRGTVKEVKVNVQKWAEDERPTFHVIIETDDGQKSDIKEAQYSVLVTNKADDRRE